MMASTGSRDRSTFMSSLRRSTSRREAATRRGGRKGEPTSPGLPTNNSVKFAGMRPSFLGQNHSSVLVFRAEPITTRAITTLHNLCPLSQEINAEATRWYSFLNNLSTKALSRDYLQSIKGVGTWLSSLRSGQCTSGYLVFRRLCGEGCWTMWRTSQKWSEGCFRAGSDPVFVWADAAAFSMAVFRVPGEKVGPCAVKCAGGRKMSAGGTI